MKLGICTPSTRNPIDAATVSRATDGVTLRFGHEVIVLGDASRWEALRANLGADSRVTDLLDDVKQDHLYLVQQKGRLFQRAHPDVTVIHDRGRFLLVMMSPAQARAIMKHEDMCYRVEAVTSSRILFEVRPRPTAALAARSAWIDSLVGSLTTVRFQTNINQLTSYTTRHSFSTGFQQALTWAQTELTGMGYTVTTQNVTVGSQTTQNLIAEKAGHQSGTRNLALIVAHLDSINLSGGSSAAAPGADDNASGSAGALTMAWALRNHNANHDLRIVLVGGEEQGLHGSQRYVNNLSTADRNRLTAVINMDMIASQNTPTPAVLLEGAAISQTLIDQLADAAAAHTSLEVQTSLSPYASDHVPFINAGLPAVLTIEGADSSNGNIHSAADTLATITASLALEILRMNTAMTATAIGQHGGLTMPTIESIADLIKIKDYNIGELSVVDWSKLLRFQYSGRYKLNGGASAREGIAGADARATSDTARLDPMYALDKPIYALEPQNSLLTENWITQLKKVRFTLHIDIDSTDPLNVVSGTVAKGLYLASVSPPHFIGQVTSNTNLGGVKHLVVENFSFQWPGSTQTINRLEIQLTGSAFVTPTADVTFVATATGQTFGPYSVTRESTYFHDVEVEFDREDGAVNVTSYNTHTHPDRPADLPAQTLTFASTFAKSGIQITASSGGNIINTTAAGANNTWNYSELHDAMEDHWSAFANNPQWKMWVFMAEHADSASLGGVMFDGDINEPGGVDRQGTAIFTECEFYHKTTGAYIQANPPTTEAVQRELFFNLIHESGHAFNLAHSFQKTMGTPWSAPSWMPVTSDTQALSWMNYPESPSPGLNATWFYERFRFRFDDNENLFLRHAPASFVQMGNADWFINHGRIARSEVDPRLELIVRTLKPVAEYGEPVYAELRLRNIGDEPVKVCANLDPSVELVELAITAPGATGRIPLFPLMHKRESLADVFLQPGQSIYQAANLTIGKRGFNFKQPGAYRIEAAYHNPHGGGCAAVMQMFVRPPRQYEDYAVINELFDARVGRVLDVGGTRTLSDVNDKLDWVRLKLGTEHPLFNSLAVVRSAAFAQPHKVLTTGSNRVTLLDADPELVERNLQPVIDNLAAAADSLGHINTREVVDRYTASAVAAGKKDEPKHAQKALLELFTKRQVVPEVLADIEQRVKELTPAKTAKKSA